MPRKPLTTPEQVFTLKELLNGRTPEFVAAALGRPTVEITAWAHDHGHPDAGRMRQHLKRAENIASRTGEDGPAEVFGRRVVDEPARRTTPVPRPDLSTAHTAPATTPPPAVMPIGPAGSSTGATPARGELVIPPQDEPTALVVPTLDALYARATTPKAQRAAQKVRDAVAALTEQITTDETAAAAKARAEQEKAAVKAEIARLEAQLAAARAKTRGGTTYHPTLPDGVTTADVRAWARDNGFDVPVRGLLSRAVVDAYTTAQNATDTAEAGAA